MIISVFQLMIDTNARAAMSDPATITGIRSYLKQFVFRLIFRARQILDALKNCPFTCEFQFAPVQQVVPRMGSPYVRVYILDFHCYENGINHPNIIRG